jgi:hypothetical protein
MKFSVLEKCTEAEFFDVIWTKILRVFLLTLHIAYGKLMSENSQDCARKPQQNHTLTNSASVHA